MLATCHNFASLVVFLKAYKLSNNFTDPFTFLCILSHIKLIALTLKITYLYICSFAHETNCIYAQSNKINNFAGELIRLSLTSKEKTKILRKLPQSSFKLTHKLKKLNIKDNREGPPVRLVGA